MAFAGLANAKDRADVIAYLKSNSWAYKWKTQFVVQNKFFMQSFYKCCCSQEAIGRTRMDKSLIVNRCKLWSSDLIA